MVSDISWAGIPADNSLNLRSSFNSCLCPGCRFPRDSYHRTRYWRVSRSRETCEYFAAKRQFLNFSRPKSTRAPIRARPRDTPTPIPTTFNLALSESCNAERALSAFEVEAHTELLIVVLVTAANAPLELVVLAVLDDMVVGDAVVGDVVLESAGAEVGALELGLPETDALS